MGHLGRSHWLWLSRGCVLVLGSAQGITVRRRTVVGGTWRASLPSCRSRKPSLPVPGRGDQRLRKAWRVAHMARSSLSAGRHVKSYRPQGRGLPRIWSRLSCALQGLGGTAHNLTAVCFPPRAPLHSSRMLGYYMPDYEAQHLRLSD